MNDNKFDFSVFRMKKSLLISKILFNIVSLLFIGIAISFNNIAGLGNDPVSVFLDGVRSFISKITDNNINDLSFATNLVLVTFFILVLIIKRKYINIATITYTLFLGSFISFGIKLYSLLGIKVGSQDTFQIISNLTSINGSELVVQIIVSVVACLLLFLGLAIFIAINIGLDSFTALAMILSDFSGKPFKVTKVIADVFFLLLGWILGGQVGIITIVAAFLGGPLINKFVLLLERTGLHTFKRNIENINF